MGSRKPLAPLAEADQENNLMQIKKISRIHQENLSRNHIEITFFSLVSPSVSQLFAEMPKAGRKIRYILNPVFRAYARTVRIYDTSTHSANTYSPPSHAFLPHWIDLTRKHPSFPLPPSPVTDYRQTTAHDQKRTMAKRHTEVLNNALQQHRMPQPNKKGNASAQTTGTPFVIKTRAIFFFSRLRSIKPTRGNKNTKTKKKTTHKFVASPDY